jgi:hypothetical protein
LHDARNRRPHVHVSAEGNAEAGSPVLCRGRRDWCGLVDIFRVDVDAVKGNAELFGISTNMPLSIESVTRQLRS